MKQLLIRTCSDPKERAHFWLPDSEATSSHDLLDSALTDRMYIDAGDVVRVRVAADEFHDDEPGPPKAHEGVQQARENRRPPYTITVRHSVQPGSSQWVDMLLPAVLYVGTRAGSDVLVEKRWRSAHGRRGLSSLHMARPWWQCVWR